MDENRARELLGHEIQRVGRLMETTREGEISLSEELADYDQHPADTGTETFEREKDLSILESLEHELAELEAALRRVDDGEYGRCEACHQAIPEERLEAQPAARFCAEHEPRR
jgi:RNA polymerase-binding transcription factor DksA